MTELFTIETEEVRLVWSRSRAEAPAVRPTGASARPFGLRTEALQPDVVPVERVHTDAGGYLFEETAYTLFAQSRAGAPITLRHRNPVLLRRLHRTDGGRVVHGTVHFGSQVGQSRFILEVAGRPHLAFSVEIFPSKLDYRQDYGRLREEVEEISTALVLEYLRSAYDLGAAVPEGIPTAAAWMLLLEHGMRDLERAVAQIARQPLWSVAQEAGTTRVERLRRPDAAALQAIRRGAGGGAWQRTRAGQPVRAQLPARPARYTLDTPEHQWLGTRLAQIERRLAGLGRAAGHRRSGAHRTAAVLETLRTLQGRIQVLQRQLPIPTPAVPPAEPPPEPSLRLLTASGYREAYRACLLLQQGLSLRSGPVRLELKDLHLLYEYWCFLTLVRLAAEETGQRLPARSLLAVERDGLRLRLRKGRQQVVRLALSSGRRLELIYNPRFGGRRYVVPQRPDMVLALYRADGAPVRCVLDAKYRVDASPGYRRRYGVPGPPAEALNDLHRYRDAILDRSQGERTVAQAAALFPYRERTPGTFSESRLARALQEVGVGALPLLPGATHHLRAWLRGVLSAEC